MYVLGQPAAIRIMAAAPYLLSLLAFWPLHAATVPYEIMPTPDSHFALEIAKTGLMAGKKHHFEFSRYHGVLQYNRERPTDSSLRLTIESKSAVCQDTWVKAKDRQKIQEYALDNMLDAGKYPDLLFQSTAIELKGAGQFQVQGQLTIRNQTRPVAVEVKLDPDNPSLLRFSGQTGLRLTDYNLKPPTAALGAIGTKDEITVLFQLTGQRAQ